ncbi:PA14 domain-containing protein [Paenibacillus roseipurpureus]|uniref:PA14 domain-containing protein n=1 Tax=Paenibacillus roseopurpureus TaxID=2918901 RepID=A0AA96LND9_9BACL|nr:PA14 domain-containing protein [Paenibacillus sp. MBLB1832]WNR42913.1 PA14 domain-containing protein [Paenibacillus sp. MBLB1832]
MKKRWWLMLIIGVISFAQAGAASAESWTPVPLVNQTIIDAGYTGGEGGQWLAGIAIAESEPSFLMAGTDVGGLFRSVDGGLNWQPANNGYDATGNSGIVIDPRNANRAIAVGANGGAHAWNGLYLTIDKGLTWNGVSLQNISSHHDFRDAQIAYDPSSYDGAAGYTKTVYWSRIGGESADKNATDHPALYKSLDGGASWAEIPNTSAYGSSRIKVSPTGGIVYAANSTGFYRSLDGGSHFTPIETTAVKSLDVIPSEPNSVWITKSDGVYKSIDQGQHFTKMVTSSTGPFQNNGPYNLKVSPANPSYMLLSQDTGVWYNQQRYYSKDGGLTWTKPTFDNSLAFLKYGDKNGIFAWHPTDANTVYSFGGDWVTKSTDGGSTFRWSGNGDNGVMIGGLFNWNVFDSNLLLLGFQDYNAAVTTDRAATWKYLNMSGFGSYGYVYGAYAATSQILYGGNAAGWTDPRFLKITRNGGTDYTDTGIELRGQQVSLGDPTDSNVLFAYEYRSTDQGLTWKPMSNVRGVLTYSPVGAKELYGSNGSSVVRSFDKGATWGTVVTMPNQGSVGDVAFDHARNRVWIAASNAKLYLYDVAAETLTEKTSSLPLDQFGNRVIWSVAVDPGNTNIVYAAGAANIYNSDAAVFRSTDGGTTWTTLTRSTRNNNPQFGMDGGRSAAVVRVNPASHEAYFGSICFGMWKIGAPANVPVPAQGPFASPTPTYSTLYAEDFNNGTASGWTLTNAAVSGKVLSVANFPASAQGIYDGAVYSGTYTYSVGIKPSGTAAGNTTRVIFNYSDSSNYYALELGGGASNTVKLLKVVGGIASTIATYPSSYAVSGKYTTINVTYELGGYISVVAVKGSASQVLFNRVQDTSLSSGKIGVGSAYNAVSFDSVFVTSPTGTITRDYWTVISGGAAYSVPVSTPPAGTEMLTKLEGPVNWADNYGDRIRGYLHPAVSGSYTFSVAGDDSADLYLSTSSNPANKLKIAYTNAWTGVREWTKYATQTSSPVNLVAGQSYYIEVVHKENTVGDHVAVGWSGPGLAATTVIDGQYLSPY